jgi:large subunit ribosomal protein L10
MARPDKEAVVEELTDSFSEAQALVITDYLGLDVAEMTELRRRLREAGVKYKVVKNTLAGIAAEKANVDEIDEYFVGPTAIAFGIDDAVSPAKILVDFAEEHENLGIKAGTLDDSIISIEKVESLAEIPPREQLLAQAFSGMQSPIKGLVSVLNGNLRGLVQTLNQIKEQKNN